jgi:hypothetical protein
MSIAVWKLTPEEFYDIITSDGDDWSVEGAEALYDHLRDMGGNLGVTPEVIRSNFLELGPYEFLDKVGLPAIDDPSKVPEYVREHIDSATNKDWYYDDVIYIAPHGCAVVAIPRKGQAPD